MIKTAALGSGLLLLATFTPVTADASSSIPTLTHAPAFGDTVSPQKHDDGNFRAGNHTLPDNPSEDLLVTSDDGRTMSVSLPDHGDGYQFKDSTTNAAQYSDASTGSDLIIQANDAGQIRVITTIPDTESQHRFEYVIDDEYSVSEDGTGGLLAYRFTDTPDDSGQESVDLVAIKAPWATAANGEKIPTHYEVHGNTITQVVEPTENAVYPISADPTWEWYDAAYGAGWNKSETRNLHKYDSAATLCTALSGALKPVCVAGATSWILNTRYAVDRGGCVFYAIAPVPVGLNYDKSKHCR